MPNCPDCATGLRTMQQAGGLVFRCEQCGGRAATIPQIRGAVGEKYGTVLLREINRATSVTPRKCPFCAQPMRQFPTLGTTLTLDACKSCGVVWFDAREFEQASELAKKCDRSRPAGGQIWSSSDDTVTTEVMRGLAAFLWFPF